MKITRSDSSVESATSVGGIIKKISGWFNKFLDWLAEDDNSDEWETSSNGDKTRTKEKKYQIFLDDSNDNVVLLRQTITQTEDEDGLRHMEELYEAKYPSGGSEKIVEDSYKYDLIESGNSWKLPGDYQQMFNKKITALVEKLTGQDSFESIEEVQASVHVTLRKVTAGEEIKAELVSIQSAMDVPSTIALISEVSEDPQFLENLPEEAATYGLEDLGDSIEVEVETEEKVDMYESLYNILAPLANLENLLKYCSWNAVGKDATNLDNTCVGLLWQAKDQIDELARLCKQLTKYCPDPREFFKDVKDSLPPNVDYESGIRLITNHCTSVIDAMQLYLCNFEESERVKILEYISGWKCQRDYFLNRLL